MTSRGAVVISLSDRRRIHARTRRRVPLKRVLVTCWFASAVVAGITLLAAAGMLVYRMPMIGLPVLVLLAGVGCWPAAGRWLDRNDGLHPALARAGRRVTGRRSSRRAASVPAVPRTTR